MSRVIAAGNSREVKRRIWIVGQRRRPSRNVPDGLSLRSALEQPDYLVAILGATGAWLGWGQGANPKHLPSPIGRRAVIEGISAGPHTAAYPAGPIFLRSPHHSKFHPASRCELGAWAGAKITDDARQHARARRVVARRVLLELSPPSGAERRSLAGSRSCADVRPAHGVHRLWDRRRRRPAELERAAAAGVADRGAMAKLKRRGSRPHGRGVGALVPASSGSLCALWGRAKASLLRRRGNRTLKLSNKPRRAAASRDGKAADEQRRALGTHAPCATGLKVRGAGAGQPAR